MVETDSSSAVATKKLEHGSHNLKSYDETVCPMEHQESSLKDSMMNKSVKIMGQVASLKYFCTSFDCFWWLLSFFNVVPSIHY